MEKSLAKPNMAMDNKNEKFSELLEESFSNINSIEGSVVTGKVITVEKDVITVDIGLKSEGRIPRENLGTMVKALRSKKATKLKFILRGLKI